MEQTTPNIHSDQSFVQHIPQDIFRNSYKSEKGSPPRDGKDLDDLYNDKTRINASFEDHEDDDDSDFSDSPLEQTETMS